MGRWWGGIARFIVCLLICWNLEEGVRGQLPGNVVFSPAELFASDEFTTSKAVDGADETTDQPGPVVENVTPTGRVTSGTGTSGIVAGPTRLNSPPNTGGEFSKSSLNTNSKTVVNEPLVPNQPLKPASSEPHSPVGGSKVLSKEEQRKFSDRLRSIIGLKVIKTTPIIPIQPVTASSATTALDTGEDLIGSNPLVGNNYSTSADGNTDATTEGAGGSASPQVEVTTVSDRSEIDQVSSTPDNGGESTNSNAAADIRSTPSLLDPEEIRPGAGVELAGDQVVVSQVRALDTGAETGLGAPEVTVPSRVITPTLLSTKKEPGPTIPHPVFSIRRDPAYPHAIMIIEYKPDTGQQQFRVNFTDLSSLNGFPPASYLIASNPFSVHQLAPGHQYEFKIFSIPTSPGEVPVLIHSQIQWTDPIVPKFKPENAEVTTNSIKLIAAKGRDYLQDYYTVSYKQIDPLPEKRHIPLNITDLPNKQIVEIFMDKLHPGTTYNITVQTFRIGRASEPLYVTLSTVPNPPEEFRVKEKGTRFLFIAWNIPKDSGFDSYHLSWVPSDVDEADLDEIPDIILTSTMYNITGLDPGKRYRLQVFTKKDDRVSEPAILQDVFTKPLPPDKIMIQPDFDTAAFRSIVRLPTSVAGALYAGCRLQFFEQSILAQSTMKLELNATVSVYDTTVCEFNLPAQGEFVVHPSEKYEVQAWAMSGGPDTESEPLRQTITIAPAFNESVFQLTFSAGHDSLRVDWPDLPFWNGIVGSGSNLTARLKLVSGVAGSSTANKSKSGERAGSMEFTDLLAGACYQWEIFTVANRERSEDKVIKNQRTDLPRLISGEPEVTSYSAILSIVILDRKVKFSPTCKLHVQVLNNTTVMLNETISVDSNIEDNGTAQLIRVPVTKLASFKIYNWNGWMVCGSEPDGGLCGPRLFKYIDKNPFKTAENVPEQVEEVEVAATEPYMARLKWRQTNSSNGEIEGYLIQVQPEVRSSEPAWNISFVSPFTSFSHAVDNLTGGFEYTFLVRARTKAGYGPASIPKTQRMPVKAPIYVKGKPKVDEASLTEHYFSISFNLGDYFLSKNGLLQKYAVIVAEVEGLKFSTSVAKNRENWAIVQDRKNWPPYIATEKKLANPSKHIDNPTILHVGRDEDCLNSREEFCNGPLRPDTEYRIRIRAYTDPDKYTDTAYSDVVRTKAVRPVTTPAIVTIVVVVALVLFVLFGIVFFRSKRTDPLTWCKSVLQREEADHIQKHEGAPNVRIDRIPQLEPLTTILPGYDLHRHRPVHRSRFAEHVRLMSADSDFRFSEEYEDLRNIGRNQPCSAADMSCNRVKNRFSNILPYDHSRVKLIPVDDEEGSDYINGNYIPGFNSPREFIAAQGPLSGTVDDFWQMMWETNSRCIVNLARCIERGREKCHQYWPDDTDPVTYGDFEVHMMTETRYPDWTIREFKMTDTGLNQTDLQSRTVRQFHYTAWPDFAVPEHPESLLKFVRVFRAKTPGNSPPVVVHCSAGVGRSGTFMAIDRSILQLDTSDLIDVFGIVYEMRMDRVLMVQNEKQYICIHQCLVCVINGEEEYPALPPIPTLPQNSYGDTPQSGRHSNNNYYNQLNHHYHNHRGGHATNGDTHNSTNSLIGGSNIDSTTLASNHTATSIGSTANNHSHGRMGTGEIHQNPVFEDDEGIVESGV